MHAFEGEIDLPFYASNDGLVRGVSPTGAREALDNEPVERIPAQVNMMSSILIGQDNNFNVQCLIKYFTIQVSSDLKDLGLKLKKLDEVFTKLASLKNTKAMSL